MRRDIEQSSVAGKRFLGFGIDPDISCVKLEDVRATFGGEFLRSPARIVAPAMASPGAAATRSSAAHNLYGIFYISPRFFVGDGNGRIDFDFDHRGCANHVSVQRDLDPATHRQQERGFSPSAAGQTPLPPNYQGSLNSVITANWQ
jgi:hypothetical protein